MHPAAPGVFPRLRRTIACVLRSCPLPPPRTSRISDSRIRELLRQEGRGTILDVGSGARRWTRTTVTFDQVTSPTVDVRGDAHWLPFGTGTFDLVLCSNVLEHLRQPDQVIAEMHRVLRPGGKVFVEMPFVYQFHGDDTSGEDDYWRTTQTGLRHALQAFAEIETGQSVGAGSVMAILIPEFLAVLFALRRTTALYNTVRNLAAWVLFPLQYVDHWIVRKPLSNRIAGGFYFLGLKPAGQPKAEAGSAPPAGAFAPGS